MASRLSNVQVRTWPLAAKVRGRDGRRLRVGHVRLARGKDVLDHDVRDRTIEDEDLDLERDRGAFGDDAVVIEDRLVDVDLGIADDDVGVILVLDRCAVDGEAVHDGDVGAGRLDIHGRRAVHGPADREVARRDVTGDRPVERSRSRRTCRPAFRCRRRARCPPGRGTRVVDDVRVGDGPREGHVDRDVLDDLDGRFFVEERAGDGAAVGQDHVDGRAGRRGTRAFAGDIADDVRQVPAGQGRLGDLIAIARIKAQEGDLVRDAIVVIDLGVVQVEVLEAVAGGREAEVRAVGRVGVLDDRDGAIEHVREDARHRLARIELEGGRGRAHVAAAVGDGAIGVAVIAGDVAQVPVLARVEPRSRCRCRGAGRSTTIVLVVADACRRHHREGRSRLPRRWARSASRR